MLNDCVAAFYLTILWLHFHSSDLFAPVPQKPHLESPGTPFFLSGGRFPQHKCIFHQVAVLIVGVNQVHPIFVPGKILHLKERMKVDHFPVQ